MKLVVVFLIFALLDIPLTLIGIGKFGIEFEANKIVRYLYLKDKIFIWILLKFTILGVIFAVANSFKKEYSMNIVFVPSIIVLIYEVFIHAYIVFGWTYLIWLT